MPGGGLLALVSQGNQNVILNGNPQFTQFYKVFKAQSHFACESATLPLDGPNELFQDQPIKLRAKIERIADLATDMTLAFDLPDIYSKWVDLSPTRQAQQEFQWVRQLGAHLIQNVAFFVGGSKVQEFDGDQIIAKAQADLDQDAFLKWQTQIGDIPELNNPSKGLQAGGTAGTGYPNVVANDDVAVQANRPSIFGQTIYVPLPLWFSESSSRALPLVGLQQHECEIQLTLRPIQELQTVLDPSGYRVRPGQRMFAPEAAIQENQPQQTPDQDPLVQFRQFATDIGFTPPGLNTWFFNPRLQATQVYLTDAERKVFASTPLNYLVNQVTTFDFPNQFTRSLLDLQITNPVTRLLIVPRRTDSIPQRNQVQNFTNWWNQPTKPFVPSPTGNAQQNLSSSSGLLIPNTQVQIIQTLRLQLDGTELQEEKPVEYQTKVQAQRTLTGGSLPESHQLPNINLSLTSPQDQPSGSVNASRIRLFQVDLNPYPLPGDPQQLQDIKIQAETINFFTVTNGQGGVMFAL